jgi:hypothetical protein
MRRLALLLPLGLLLAAATAEARGPRILATGDSMIQIVDVKLEEKLERIEPVSFRSDARVGSGISKGDWVGIARRQARRHRPRATVVFIGANDGFNIGRARCCRGEWVERYGRRVRRMIRAYSLRGKAAGLGEVYWLTLPAPRPAHWRPVYRAVDRAIRRAVKASGPHAHLIDAWKVFTPHGRFRRSMRWRGRRVVVRQDDGVHLSWAGASIAAGLVRDAMRKDAVVG